MGIIYRIRYAAKNLNGLYSEWSDILLAALGPLPSKPVTPTKDITNSKGDMLSIEWTKITTDSLPIYGYELYADSGNNDEFKRVYDGSKSPQINTFAIMNVSDSLTYRVKIRAINFNGFGPFSDTASL